MLRYLILFSSIVLLAFSASAQQGKEAGNPADYDEEKTNYYLSKKREKPELAEVVIPMLPAHQRTFVEGYQKVKRQKDKKVLESIIHPASKACESDKNRDYFDYMREFYLTEELPEGYRLQILVVDEEKRWPLKLRLGMPLAPTHVMYMEFRNGDDIEGWQRYLREETYPQPALYELVRCPDQETLERFRSGDGLVE